MLPASEAPMTNRLAALALASLALSACCFGGGGSGGDGLFANQEARRSFVPSFNQNGIKGCNLVAQGPKLEELEYTCKSEAIQALETAIKPTCVGFQMVGFRQMKVLGKDGNALVDIGNGCSFRRL